MFELEGLSLPASIKVEDGKRKKKTESEKLTGDDLQGMFNELSSTKQNKPKNKAEKKAERSNVVKSSPFSDHDMKRDSAANARKRQSSPEETPSSKRTKPKQGDTTNIALKQATNEPKKQEKLKDNLKNVIGEETTAATKKEKAVTPKSKAENELAPAVRSSKQLTPLQLKMQQKLSGSRFRWINEQLYTTSSDHAFKIFQEQPQVFQEYHDGFRHQVESWPENPVVSLVQQFKDRLQKPLNAPGALPADKKSGHINVADMGCGEAELALELGKLHHRKAKLNVHSFDLYAANERITAADIANVPLPDESCHVVVFCLALMGTNLVDFISEGIRILKPGGLIWIAEIKSRFSGYDTFIDKLKQMGLYHRSTDETNKMFVKFEFTKLPHKMAQASEERPELTLKPCIYKRR